MVEVDATLKKRKKHNQRFIFGGRELPYCREFQGCIRRLVPEQFITRTDAGSVLARLTSAEEDQLEPTSLVMPLWALSLAAYANRSKCT